MKNDNLLPAIFAGLAAGAILGILFAEKKGADTRDELRTDCNKWINKMGRKTQSREWDNAAIGENTLHHPNF